MGEAGHFFAHHQPSPKGSVGEAISSRRCSRVLSKAREVGMADRAREFRDGASKDRLA